MICGRPLDECIWPCLGFSERVINRLHVELGEAWGNNAELVEQNNTLLTGDEAFRAGFVEGCAYGEMDAEKRLAHPLNAKLGEWLGLRGALEKAKAELVSIREVADPDREHTELSTRECVMHIGEQAALLESVNRMCERRGAERDAIKSDYEDLAKQRNELLAETERLKVDLRDMSTLAREGFSQGWDGLDSRDKNNEVSAILARTTAP